MSSSASHAQLEMPRLGHRFFTDAGFDMYDDSHYVIDELTFLLDDRVFEDRPITWHGHNRMERVNLPTSSMGGPRYSSTAILFRRAEIGFQVVVVPWRSAEADVWRSESASRGHIYRLGHNTSRMCGLL
jgi:hypothetical protein